MNFVRIWCITNPSPARRVTPPETLHGKIWILLTGLPGLVDRSPCLDRSPHLSCQHDQIKLRDYMDRQVTLPNRVTSHTWGPPPPCKHATSKSFGMGPTWFDMAKCNLGKVNLELMLPAVSPSLHRIRGGAPLDFAGANYVQPLKIFNI